MLTVGDLQDYAIHLLLTLKKKWIHTFASTTISSLLARLLGYTRFTFRNVKPIQNTTRHNILTLSTRSSFSTTRPSAAIPQIHILLYKVNSSTQNVFCWLFLCLTFTVRNDECAELNTQRLLCAYLRLYECDSVTAGLLWIHVRVCNKCVWEGDTSSECKPQWSTVVCTAVQPLKRKLFAYS